MSALEGMTPEQFVLWLNGYIAGSPEGVDDVIKDQLAVVVGQVVKNRLLDGRKEASKLDTLLDDYRRAQMASKPSPYVGVGTASPSWAVDPSSSPYWGGTTCLTTAQLAAQCDEEKAIGVVKTTAV